jgi:hypothetical protein
MFKEQANSPYTRNSFTLSWGVLLTQKKDIIYDEVRNSCLAKQSLFNKQLLRFSLEGQCLSHDTFDMNIIL